MYIGEAAFKQQQKIQEIRQEVKTLLMSVLSNTHADTPEERNLLNKLIVSLDKEQ